MSDDKRKVPIIGKWSWFFLVTPIAILIIFIGYVDIDCYFDPECEVLCDEAFNTCIDSGWRNYQERQNN